MFASALRGPSVAGPCEVCRQWDRGAPCAECIARDAAPQPRCAGGGLRPGLPAPARGACPREPPPYARRVCAADDDHPWDALIAAFSFQGRSELAVRGHDRAWELARRAASALQLQADAALLRRLVGRPAHQAGLTRAERLRSLQSAFMVEPRRRARIEGRRSAWADDVTTTGATPHHAAGVLLRAGAAAVGAWVPARTPDAL